MSQLMGAHVAGWILTALVLLLLVVNGAVLKKPVQLLLTGNWTTGVVVGWTQDGTLKAPIVQFIAQGGAHVRISGRVSVASHSVAWPLTRLRMDDAVEVIYLARRPHYGIVNTWDELYMAPLFFGAMTLGFLVILVGVLRGPYG